MDGDVRAVYKPTNVLLRGGGDGGGTSDEEDGGRASLRSNVTGGSGNNMMGEEELHVGIRIETVNRRWSADVLTDPAEHAHLHTALMNKYY
jgi:hypothetical protein